MNTIDNMLATLMAIELGKLIIEVQKGHKHCTVALLQDMSGLNRADAELVVNKVWKDLTEREVKAYEKGLADGVDHELLHAVQAVANKRAEPIDVDVEVIDSKPTAVTERAVLQLVAAGGGSNQEE